MIVFLYRWILLNLQLEVCNYFDLLVNIQNWDFFARFECFS